MLTIKTFLNYLQNFTKSKVTQADIAKALNVSRGNITHRAKSSSELKISEARKVIEFLGLAQPHEVLNAILKANGQYLEEAKETSMPESINDDCINVDYYPDVFGSCGAGAFVYSECKELMQVPKKLIKSYSGFKKYSVINATGDSMSPYILDKDMLVVEHYNGEQISDNKIYVFRFYDNIFIKRLVLNLDQIVVKSDNMEYQARFIERAEADNFQIIGRIVAILRHE